MAVHTLTAEHACAISGWGTVIPQARQCGHKNKIKIKTQNKYIRISGLKPPWIEFSSKLPYRFQCNVRLREKNDPVFITYFLKHGSDVKIQN